MSEVTSHGAYIGHDVLKYISLPAEISNTLFAGGALKESCVRSEFYISVVRCTLLS